MSKSVWRTKKKKPAWEMIISIVSVLALGGMLLVFLWDTWVDGKCAECGWSEGKITVFLESYCSREEKEYEITRPLWWVQENGCIEWKKSDE